MTLATVVEGSLDDIGGLQGTEGLFQQFLLRCVWANPGGYSDEKSFRSALRAAYKTSELGYDVRPLEEHMKSGALRTWFGCTASNVLPLNDFRKVALDPMFGAVVGNEGLKPMLEPLFASSHWVLAVDPFLLSYQGGEDRRDSLEFLIECCQSRRAQLMLMTAAGSMWKEDGTKSRLKKYEEIIRNRLVNDDGVEIVARQGGAGRDFHDRYVVFSRGTSDPSSSKRQSNSAAVCVIVALGQGVVQLKEKKARSVSRIDCRHLPAVLSPFESREERRVRLTKDGITGSKGEMYDSLEAAYPFLWCKG